MGFGFKDIIDILIVAILLYQTFRLIRGSGALPVFLGVLAFSIIYFLVSLFKLSLTGAIFDKLFGVASLILVVTFQDEIRRFFTKLGSHKNWNLLKKIGNLFGKSNDVIEFPTMRLVLACRNMARTKTGALIVVARQNRLDDIVATGDRIDADINTRLIENIFFKNSPLHDGAMIIRDGRIAAAGCILPVSNNPEIPRHLGLRHRAAMGISESSDAAVIVVSEETGTITMAINGAYKLNITPEALERELTTLIQSNEK